MDYIRERSQSQVMVNSFIQSVYNWMTVGLGITAVVAFLVANSEFMIRLIFGNPFILWGLIIGEFVLVFVLASRIGKMDASTATALFILYSALNGATLSSIFLVYDPSAITSAFLVCALTFGACSIYGMTTKRASHFNGQFYVYGAYRNYYSLNCEFFSAKLCNEYDHQLSWCFHLHRLDCI